MTTAEYTTHIFYIYVYYTLTYTRIDKFGLPKITKPPEDVKKYARCVCVAFYESAYIIHSKCVYKLVYIMDICTCGVMRKALNVFA